MKGVYDGFVSRHLNRRLSAPAARALSRTPVTPNQVSVASLGVAFFSFLSFAYGYNVVGGILAQASSIVDGVDGDLARAKGLVSPFGGFLDAVLDRYADCLILLGLTIWATSGRWAAAAWPLGFGAMAGTLVVSYTRARIQEPSQRLFDRGVTSVASRDVRLLLVMIGALSGQAVATLAVIAALTHIAVLLRLFYAWRALAKEGRRE